SSLLTLLRSPSSPLFPYTTLFRSEKGRVARIAAPLGLLEGSDIIVTQDRRDGDDTVALIHQDQIHQKPGGTSVAVLKRMDVHQRSEEHTSELQSRFDLVCRLLLEK